MPRAAELQPADPSSVREESRGYPTDGLICDWRARLVLDVLSGHESPDGAAKRLDIDPETIREWTMHFVRGGERAIDAASGDDPADRAEDLRADVDRLSDELERLRRKLATLRKDRSSQRGA